MTTDTRETRRRQAATTARPAVGRRARIGLGSVFGKTLRDSRRGLLVQFLLLGVLPLLLLDGIATQYATPAARAELVRVADTVGTTAQGLTGPPVNVGTMGGYLQWKYGAVLALIVAVWSVLTLTRTLAGEARTGSLDVLASVPIGRRRIALEKVAAHLVALAAISVTVTLATALGGAAFAKLPGDRIPLAAAAGFGAWIGLLAAAFGGLGLALSALLGRAAGAWVAGTLLVAGPLLNNYRTLVPAFRGVADLTPWAWTDGHLPLAGRTDPAALIPVAIAAVALLWIGVEAFARRDLDAAARVRLPRPVLPATGLGDPLGRTLRELAPLAVAWGASIGVFGLAMASASRSLADSFATSPDLVRAFRRAFPGFDTTSAGGFLQLMVQLMFVAAGFAAVTLVSRWSADETSHRLEVVLASPVSRAAWVVRSGLGVLAAVLVMSVLISAGIGLGALIAGSDPGAPMGGAFSLGLFAAALAGVGLAVAGLVRASVAAGVVAVVVAFTYLVDLLAPALHLPDWVRDLALTAHLGQPMVGNWGLGGVLACLALAVAGPVVGGWGLSRRDLQP